MPRSKVGLKFRREFQLPIRAKKVAGRQSILVAGSVGGHFKRFYDEVSKVNSKCGPFECVLCMGDFFGPNEKEWQHILCGIITVPIQTYILGPNNLDYKGYFTNSGAIGPNIHYLGKSGILKCTSGLQIAYLSGTHGTGDKLVHYDETDVDELIRVLEKERHIDVLMTSQWPKGITKHDPLRIAKESEENSSPLIAKLAQALKPRYHFSTCPGYYFIPTPYRNYPWSDEDKMHVTRFLSVSAVNAPKKWLYAVNIIPSSRPDPKLAAPEPRDVTDNPYPLIQKEPERHFSYFDHASSSSKRHSDSDMQSKSKRVRDDSEMVNYHEEEECWFCLSSDKVTKHLIVSVSGHVEGDEIDISTPEPPDVQPSTSAQLTSAECALSFSDQVVVKQEPGLDVSANEETGMPTENSNPVADVSANEETGMPTENSNPVADVSANEETGTPTENSNPVADVSANEETGTPTENSNPVAGSRSYFQRVKALRDRRHKQQRIQTALQRKASKTQDDIKNNLVEINESLMTLNATMLGLNDTMVELLNNSQRQIQNQRRNLRNQTIMMSLLAGLREDYTIVLGDAD